MSDKRTDLPSPTAPNFQQRVREALQTYLGRQGDPLDRGLTLRDLIAAGVIRLRDGFPLRPGSGVPPIEPAVPGQEDYVPDLTPPPTPTGFLVSAGISYVFVEHDQPSYTNGHGHLRTRLYGATHESGNPLPTFDDAVELSQFSGRVYAYPTNPATTWHLWIKWESVDGVLSLPAGGTNGQSVTTGQNVSDLLEVLNGQLSESQLAAALNTRINLIDNPTTGLQAQVSALDSEVSTLQGQVAALEGTPTYDPLVTYAQGDMVQYNGSLYIAKSSTTGNAPTNTTYWDLVGQYASLGEAVQALTVDVADHENRIGVVEGGLGAEVTARETLAAQMRGSYTGTDVTQLTQGLVWSERQARATAVSAEASARDALATQLRGTYTGTDLNLVTSGLIASERVARSNAIGTVTTEINTLRSDAQTWDGQVFTNAQSWVQGNYLTAADTNSAISSAVNTVNARLNSGGDTYNAIVQSQTTASAKNASFVQSATPTATKLNDLWIHTGQQNKLYRWDGTSWVVADDQRIGSTASQVTTLSSTVQNVSDTVDGLTNDVAALEISASTSANNITGLQAQYTVKVDVNGYVSGYGLASTANNGTPSSEFIVVADKFSIAPVATNPGAADGSPFYHLTVPTTVNGVTVPAGTYMKAAYIADATIGRAMIKDAAIDDAKIANLSAAKITAGTISADRLDSSIITAKVANLDAAVITSGFIGTARIQDATITGAKIAGATIGTANIGDAQITNAKIADAAITTAKIGDAQITTAKIGDAQITNAKITDLDGGKITARTIDSLQIKINGVDTVNMIAEAVTQLYVADATSFYAPASDPSARGASLYIVMNPGDRILFFAQTSTADDGTYSFDYRLYAGYSGENGVFDAWLPTVITIPSGSAEVPPGYAVPATLRADYFQWTGQNQVGITFYFVRYGGQSGGTNAKTYNINNRLLAVKVKR